VAEYLRKLRPGGLLAFHISNQFLTLEPVLARIAGALGLAGVIRTDETSVQVEEATGRLTSVWVVIARQRSDLGPLASDAKWLPVQTSPGVGLWTDEFSNIWSVFDWK
jgi:hypothetical protein